jgi:hypothetical protein
MTGESCMFFDCADCLETAPTKIAHTEVSRAHLGHPPPKLVAGSAITGTLGSVPLHVAAGLYEMKPLRRP